MLSTCRQRNWNNGWQRRRVGGAAIGPTDHGHPAQARAALTAADYAHMRKVVGFLRRHLAQRPSDDIMHTRWRYSLMNWGHDPLKD
jgi:hypothetical protein